MKENPALQQLIEKRNELTEQLRQLPAEFDLGSLQPLMADLDPARPATGSATGCAAFIETCPVEDFCQEWLRLDIQLLERLLETGADQTVTGPCGVSKTVLPLRYNNQVIYTIVCGPFFTRPLGEDEKSLLTQQGLADDELNALPILGEDHIRHVLFLYRRVRDSLEKAIDAECRSQRLTRQLIDSERIQSLGTLSGGVAHRFNNLLSVILGYSSYVLNREEISDESSDALKRITEAAQRGRRLTEELLAFAGSDVEEESRCSVHETLTSVLSLLQSQTHSRIQVETRLDADTDEVFAPRSAIHQVVFNLLNNAINSMPEGGELAVRTSNTEVTETDHVAHYLRIEVVDSAGILPASAEQVPGADRMGFQLSSVYGIVGKLDGTVLTSATPGSETRVEVLLPTAEEEEHVREQNAVADKLGPRTIWVVDDDPIFREMSNVVLSEQGHTVEEIPGGEPLHAEWEQAESQPDLIIIDFSMPDYNGLELREWLHEHGCKAPIVLVSGLSADQPDIKKALSMKRTHFLQKPFSFRELADIVAMALGEELLEE